MTIYSGKDAKVYMEEYEMPRVRSFSVIDGRRTFIIENYQGDVRRFRAKPLPSGEINFYDMGMPHLLHFTSYKTVVGGKLVAKWHDDRYTIGFPFPNECTTYTTVYNGSPTTIDFDIPATAITDGITFKTIHLYVDGIGTPNSATYTVNLRESTTTRDTETFTWTTNDGRWISLTTIDYTTSNNANWNIQITTSDAGTNITNCQRVYKIVGTEYPFFDTDTGCCMLEIEDWSEKAKKVNLNLEVSTNYKAVINGVVWEDLDKVYSAGSIGNNSISYTADSIEWTEL